MSDHIHINAAQTGGDETLRFRVSATICQFAQRTAKKYWRSALSLRFFGSYAKTKMERLLLSR